jgi:hypothetical protein
VAHKKYLSTAKDFFGTFLVLKKVLKNTPLDTMFLKITRGEDKFVMLYSVKHPNPIPAPAGKQTAYDTTSGTHRRNSRETKSCLSRQGRRVLLV